MTDVTSGTTLLSVQGPASRELLSRLTDGDLSNTSFPYLSARQLHVGYAPALAVRVTYVGELGFELHVPAEYGAGVYDDLMAAGADLGVRPVGLAAMTSLRLEKGYRDFGVDIDNTDTPLAAGLGFAVAWDKPGGFVGRDALAKVRAEGRRAPAWSGCWRRIRASTFSGTSPSGATVAGSATSGLLPTATLSGPRSAWRRSAARTGSPGSGSPGRLHRADGCRRAGASAPADRAVLRSAAAAHPGCVESSSAVQLQVRPQRAPACRRTGADADLNVGPVIAHVVRRVVGGQQAAAGEVRPQPASASTTSTVRSEARPGPHIQ